MKPLEPVAHPRSVLAARRPAPLSANADGASWLHRFLHDRALSATVPRLSQPVGVVPWRDYFDDLGMERLGWRAVRRALVFALSGQAAHLHSAIDRRWGRGLILYFGADQLGDALMDLAPRSLLSEAGLDMDLLTAPMLAPVFQGDPWLGRVSADVHSLRDRDYDFALVLSHKRRSLQFKREHFPRLPWVSLHGVFSGPDFDRAGFAAQRLADLLGAALGPAERDRHARQKLGPVRVACPNLRTQQA